MSSHHTGHDDEAVDFWVSYSDLMAGLLLVFILLLISTLMISRASLEAQQEALEQREQELKSTEEQLKTLNSDVADILGVRVELLKRLKERFSSTGGEISFDDATGAVRLGSNILFDEGSAELSKEGRETLEKTLPTYYEALLGDPRLRGHVDQIVFEGHTNSNFSSGSEDPAKAYLFNLRLSQARAYAAMEHVIKANISPELNASSLLAANGYSSSRLLYLQTAEGKEEDKVGSRRLELRFRLKDEAALNKLKELFELRQAQLKESKP